MRCFFAPSRPKFRWTPRCCPWGPHLSVFWFGRELVIELPQWWT